MSSYSSSSDDDDEMFYAMKYQKYTKALHKFNNEISKFEAIIPDINQLSYNKRVDFVIANYEKHLHGLHGRRKGIKMGTIDGMDELKSFCKAICIGWKLFRTGQWVYK